MRQRRSIEPGMTRIIVKGTNWIGDVFLSLPAVYSLRHIFPDAAMDVALKRPLGDLLGGVDEIDTVLDYDEGVRGEIELVRGIRRGAVRYRGHLSPVAALGAPRLFGGGAERDRLCRRREVPAADPAGREGRPRSGRSTRATTTGISYPSSEIPGPWSSPGSSPTRMMPRGPTSS